VPSVYIETTIPSYYYETRRTTQILAWREATRVWWDTCCADYELYTSRYVLGGLTLSPPPKAEKCLALLKNLPVLPLPPDIDQVIEYYQENYLMPAGAGGDAFHLAMASMHKMDFLLTWNCRHLANANKYKQITVLNGRLGLYVPVITTPLTLLPEDLK
jgi:hypothetical protein